MLFDPKIGLKLRTTGYQWAKANMTGCEKVLCINPSNKYTISEAFELGKVEKIWAVNSNSNQIDKTLKERAKERLRQRQNPHHGSFKEYMDTRTSCWILEEMNGEFYCDCPISMKGKLCQHSNGMLYIQGNLEVTSEVRSVPLGQKRKRGRPKKLPSCLTKSPIQVRVPAADVQEDHPVADVLYEDPDVQVHLGLEPTRQAVQPCTVPLPSQEQASSSRRKRRTKAIPDKPIQKSAYELMREDNIREREALFESLEITEAVVSCREALPVASSRRGRGTKRKTVEQASPRRLRSRK